MHSTTLWLKALLLTVVAFFAPIHKLMALTTALIAVDFMTGLVASWKSGKPITSSRMGASAAKIAVYSVGLCTAFLVEKVFIPELPVVRMLAALVGMREMLSIFENLNIASGQNLLTALIGKLQSDNDKTPPQS